MPCLHWQLIPPNSYRRPHAINTSSKVYWQSGSFSESKSQTGFLMSVMKTESYWGRLRFGGLACEVSRFSFGFESPEDKNIPFARVNKTWTSTKRAKQRLVPTAEIDAKWKRCLVLSFWAFSKCKWGDITRTQKLEQRFASDPLCHHQAPVNSESPWMGKQCLDCRYWCECCNVFVLANNVVLCGKEKCKKNDVLQTSPR